MKKLSIVCSLFVFAVSTLFAQSTEQVTFRGTISLLPGATLSSGYSASISRPNHRGHTSDDIKGAAANASALLATVSAPTPKPTSVISPDRSFFGFPGLTEFDQVTAGTGVYAGTQQPAEPPDQGLCVGNGFVVEPINVALAVYSSTGSLLSGPVPLNQFYRLAPELSGSVFGPFLSDPRCYFDPGTQRWFHTILEIDTDPKTGNFGTHSSTLIAVSKTSNPIGDYFLFSIDTTDDGTHGTPKHPHCPCFGDQPLLGADAHGIYISTNEFPIANTPFFNGSQIYAISKTALEGGAATKVVHINAGAIPVPKQDQATGIWYSIQPATSPNEVENDAANAGVEYFLSALQFGPAPFDNRIAVWALSNTSSLESSKPNTTLQHVVIKSEAYGVATSRPFAATQKAGPTPLRDFLNRNFNDKDPLELLNANDDRMNQVVFANGNLYSGVNTSVIVNKQTLQGIAYFIVEPKLGGGVLSAQMSGQGYVAVAKEHVLFPSIGVNTIGKAVMAFSLSGPDYFPSAAYTPLQKDGTVGNVRLAAPGIGPYDGGSGYNFFNAPQPGIARWGDYSAAVADAQGNIWFGAEYVGQKCSDVQFLADPTCGGTRDFFANWWTFLGRVQVQE